MESWSRKTRGIHRRGTRANQPAATDVLIGTLYFVIDEFVIERSNGTSWENNSIDLKTGIVINESGADSDTRIESNNQTNMFFVDAGNDRIGIGTASPSVALEIGLTADLSLIGSQASFYLERASGGTFLFQAASAGGRTAIRGLSNHPVGFWANNIEIIFLDTNGNVGIGTLTPATSAKVEIDSTTGAFLIPRMTSTQRDALTAVNGMLIYNSTLNKFQGYENGTWTSLI